LKGHNDKITSARFSPDGASVLTTSNDNTARIWEAVSGREQVVFKSHEPVKRISEARVNRDAEVIWQGVYSGAFSRDGTKVVTGGEDGARIWDSGTGHELMALKHTDAESHTPMSMSNVSFSADGRRVLTRSVDAQLWDSDTGAILATLDSGKNRCST